MPCTTCGRPAAKRQDQCDDCRIDALWTSLPADVRAQVDDLITTGRPINAVAAARDGGPQPRPPLQLLRDLVERRGEILRNA